MSVTVVRKEVAEILGRAGPGRLVVGCSGGPDSMVLADCVLALRGADAHLVYVNHGLRPEAEEEGAKVVAFARAAGADGRVARVTVTPEGTGWEDAARRARHAALVAVADEIGARWVLLGHTAADQAETVLARLLRGTGVKGLAGMAQKRGRFLRPLLTFPRERVLAYVAERGLRPVTDPMNADRRFLRVRIRNELLPTLRQENPNIDAALCRTARFLREASEALDWAVLRAQAELGHRLLAPALAALPATLAKRVLAERAGVPLEAVHLRAALALATRPTRGSAELHLPGVILRRQYDELLFVRESAEPSRVSVEDGSPPDGPYLVRTFRPGDRMKPARLKGHSRKLSDLFIDAKVPAALRRAAVVILRARDGAIVWAEHIGPSVDARLRVALTPRDPPVI